MSRTYRKTPKHRPFRKIKHHNTLKGEYETLEDLESNDFVPTNRHMNRANKYGGKVLSNWDDVHVSALNEVYDND